MLLRVKSKAVCLLVSSLTSCSMEVTLKLSKKSVSVLHLGVRFLQSTYKQESLPFLLYFLPLLINLILLGFPLLVNQTQYWVG